MTALKKAEMQKATKTTAKPNQMAVARQVMKKRSSLLRELAK